MYYNILSYIHTLYVFRLHYHHHRCEVKFFGIPKLLWPPLTPAAAGLISRWRIPATIHFASASMDDFDDLHGSFFGKISSKSPHQKSWMSEPKLVEYWLIDSARMLENMDTHGYTLTSWKSSCAPNFDPLVAPKAHSHWASCSSKKRRTEPFCSCCHGFDHCWLRSPCSRCRILLSPRQIVYHGSHGTSKSK